MFAAAGTSLALLAGGVMALFASQSWWAEGGRGKRAAGPLV